MFGSVDWWLVTKVSGQPVGPIFKGQAVQKEFFRTAWPLKIEQISFPETSVNYQWTLRNIPEEPKPHLYRSQNLKSNNNGKFEVLVYL
jgi:hypothetical protein